MLSSQTRIYCYALLAIAGLVFTMYYNIQFIIEHGGFSVSLFVKENYLNAASASISNDVIVASLVFLFWSYFEAQRLRMKHWWVYLITNFCIAFAFAFPLFLLMRERALANGPKPFAEV